MGQFVNANDMLWNIKLCDLDMAELIENVL